MERDEKVRKVEHKRMKVALGITGKSTWLHCNLYNFSSLSLSLLLTRLNENFFIFVSLRRFFTADEEAKPLSRFTAAVTCTRVHQMHERQETGCIDGYSNHCNIHDDGGGDDEEHVNH